MPSQEVARKSGKALALLGTLKADPTAAAYAIAYRMVEEPMGELARAVEALVRTGMPLDESRCAHLNSHHIEAPMARTLKADSNEMGEQMRSVLGLVAEASRASGEFGQTVTRAGVAMGEAKGEAALAGIVAGLLDHTRAMEATQDRLNRALAEKETEIQAINSKYVAALSEARQDPLTALANRKHFDERIYRETVRSEDGISTPSLLMIDIDHFKRINDRYGHPAGDAVIREVGEIIRSSVRAADLPARVGGEEFAVILSGSDAVAATGVAERIRRRVQETGFDGPDGPGTIRGVTVSIGVATHNRGEMPESLVARADACLYGAKRTGRNRLVSETNVRPANATAAA